MIQPWMLYVVGSAILLGFIKRCSPERHERSVYYRTKGRRE